VIYAGQGPFRDREAGPLSVYGSYGRRGRSDQPAATDEATTAMGIDWLPWPALTQAIPPAYTHYRGVQRLTRSSR
jgi:hypothetical protein